MTHQDEGNSLFAKAFGLFIGNWKSQSILYGITFCTALATALFADLVLRQSETFAAALTSIVVIALLFLTPLIRAGLYGDSFEGETRQLTLHEQIAALLDQVNELAINIDESRQPSEILLNRQAVRDLALIIKETRSSSTIQSIRDLLYADPRLQLPPSTPTDEFSEIVVPTGIKGLLEEVAMKYGFSSGAKYLEYVLSVQANRIRESEKRKVEESEVRRREQVSSRYGQASFGEYYSAAPQASTERWPIDVRPPYLKN